MSEVKHNPRHISLLAHYSNNLIALQGRYMFACMNLPIEAKKEREDFKNIVLKETSRLNKKLKKDLEGTLK